MMGRLLKLFFFAGAFFIIAGISTYGTLHLFMGSRSGTVVPDLSGQHVVTALERLSDLSLNTKIKGMLYSSEVPIHHVISQNPLPGTEIKPGRDVRIILSKGPESVRVPSLTGLTLIQARIVLEENGLSAGSVARVYTDTQTDGEVLAQSPSSGKIIRRETPVGLLISLGRRPVEYIMPDLSGVSLHEALARIEKLQLTLGKVSAVSNASLPVDKIIDQAPSPGHLVSEKDIIDITLNRREPSDTGQVAIQNRLTLLRHSLEPGFLNRHIRLRLNCFSLSMDLLDSYIKPGGELWFLIPAETNTTAFLYEDDVLIKTEVIE